MPPTATIYALGDPFTGRLRYVGQTAGALSVRVADHVSEARCSHDDTPKLRWLRGLLVEGLAPLVMALEVVPRRERFMAEKRWIWRLREWHHLLNSRPGPQAMPCH